MTLRLERRKLRTPTLPLGVYNVPGGPRVTFELHPSLGEVSMFSCVLRRIYKQGSGGSGISDYRTKSTAGLFGRGIFSRFYRHDI